MRDVFVKLLSTTFDCCACTETFLRFSFLFLTLSSSAMRCSNVQPLYSIGMSIFMLLAVPFSIPFPVFPVTCGSSVPLLPITPLIRLRSCSLCNVPSFDYLFETSFQYNSFSLCLSKFFFFSLSSLCMSFSHFFPFAKFINPCTFLACLCHFCPSSALQFFGSMLLEQLLCQCFCCCAFAQFALRTSSSVVCN